MIRGFVLEVKPLLPNDVEVFCHDLDENSAVANFATIDSDSKKYNTNF